MTSKGLKLIVKITEEIEECNRKQSDANSDLAWEWIKNLQQDMKKAEEVPILVDFFNWKKLRWDKKIIWCEIGIRYKEVSISNYVNAPTLEVYYKNYEKSIIKVSPKTEGSETKMFLIIDMGEYEKKLEVPINYDEFLESICNHIANRKVKFNARNRAIGAKTFHL